MRKSFGYILAILIASGIIGVAHAVVYEALATIITTLFPISTSPAASVAILCVFVFLALSFMVATFTSMKFNNLPVRIFYTCSAVWAGCVIYLFFAAFAYGLLCMIPVAAVSLFSSITVAWVGAVLMIAAFFTGIYGICNASTMRVVEATIPLRDLPPAWKNKKAVWVSDVHLGHVRGACFAKKVSDKILSLKPDIVFVGGDLYDGSKVDALAIAEPFRALTGTHAGPIPLGVYFVMGNHEEFHERDIVRYMGAVRDIGMKILDNEMAVVDGMQIIGVDHGATDSAEKFASVLGKIVGESGFDRKKPSILLKHEPRDLAVGARAGISFQISGHTHRGQIFPVSLVTWLTFHGFDYGLKKFHLEKGQGSVDDSRAMEVYTSSGVGTWGPPLRVGTKSEIVLFHFIDAAK